MPSYARQLVATAGRGTRKDSRTSRGKGKSGGARIISYVLTRDQEIYLLSIYDKSEQDSISDDEIKELIKQL